jgi:hypothetical protein
MLKPARDPVDQTRPNVSPGALFTLQLGGDREQKLLPLPKGIGALSSRNRAISSSVRLSGGMFRPRGGEEGQAGRP